MTHLLRELWVRIAPRARSIAWATVIAVLSAWGGWLAHAVLSE